MIVEYKPISDKRGLEPNKKYLCRLFDKSDDYPHYKLLYWSQEHNSFCAPSISGVAWYLDVTHWTDIPILESGTRPLDYRQEATYIQDVYDIIYELREADVSYGYYSEKESERYYNQAHSLRQMLIDMIFPQDISEDDIRGIMVDDCDLETKAERLVRVIGANPKLLAIVLSYLS